MRQRFLKSMHHFNNLYWFKDGDATVIVQENFVDLQESWAYFPECKYCGSSDVNVTMTHPHGWSFVCNECARNNRLTFWYPAGLIKAVREKQ